MPPSKAYGIPGGYTNKQLKEVALPEKIKCSICKVHRNKDSYSKRQLGELQWKFSQRSSFSISHANIKCRKCTGSQTTEMMCIVCDVVKGLDEFSKAQRKDPDKARCINCINLHLSTEPGADPVYHDNSSGEEDEDDFDSDDSDDTNPWATESQLDGMSQAGQSENPFSADQLDQLTISSELSEAGSVAATETETDMEKAPMVVPSSGSETSSVAGGGVGLSAETTSEEGGWITQPRRRSERKGKEPAGASFTGYDNRGQGHRMFKTPSTPGSGAWDYSGFDPRGYGHRSLQTPSTPGGRGYENSGSSKGNTSGRAGKGGGWAKLKADKHGDGSARPLDIFTADLDHLAVGAKNVSYDDDSDEGEGMAGL
ncbi:MAG: hypothetical protein M1817_001497 [Caeruleum heppii]|nr:MAG: hypothetical protein M1817_001497 [Caeruleum heppii]